LPEKPRSRHFLPTSGGVKGQHLNFEGESNMAKAKKGKSAAPTEMLLVSSKVRAMIKDAGCNTAGDALDGLNNYVGWLVAQAAKRAGENGRKTVRAHDFIIP
jgi:histone H3/H4